MLIVLVVLSCFALFLLAPEEEAPELDDEWARREWLERHHE